MPPRLNLRPIGHRSALYARPIGAEKTSVCFFCSLSSRPSAQPTRRPRRKAPNSRRFTSTAAPPAGNAKLDTRDELQNVLLELQKRAANYVNLSRLQLALNGLRQKPGNESIRVAVLGLTSGSESGKTAKQVLKLLIADPLKEEEEWEKEVDQHNLAQPMIIRVGEEAPQERGAISITKGNLLHEVHVSSATLNGHNLELLLMETNPFMSQQEVGALEGFEDSVLVPTVDIPTSNTGQYTPITTPVHKALIVADGILGAASVVSMPTLESKDIVTAAVNMPDYKPADASPLPFTPIDVTIATLGLGIVRENLSNAIEFEHLWFQSNLPKLVEWLKADIITTPENTTKPPVKELISSLLRNTSAAIEKEQARRLGSSLASTAFPTTLTKLQRSLDDWAESAHTELQEQLDLAFSSGRWRKLGWWKLFWRVDDVGMLTNDILNQRFLTASESSAIFLAGRMAEAGISVRPSSPTPPASGTSTELTDKDNSSTNPDPGASDAQTPAPAPPLWPTNISTTRTYLATETIPALQALAQKLMLQTLSTSGLTSALGALVYVGTLTTTAYEAGAVAALGIVWSLRRMQKQWETARAFWEGEVREEGRKAVRGVEGVVGEALVRNGNSRTTGVEGGKGKGEGKGGNEGEGEGKGEDGGEAELGRARDLVERAWELLRRLK
ncbi:hypothetical protein F5B20DRAFT_287346 [Whalleya microplaca]|nr:hypothetical protein F5B20DRAFT_287346 [Whalleya microplaca]